MNLTPQRTKVAAGMIAAVLALLGIGTAPAAAETVHDGMTAAELAAFGERAGWKAKVDTATGTIVTFRPDGRAVRVEMFDCDETKRCRSGVIRQISYQWVVPRQGGFWHWNLSTQGATGFGPGYVTLQRYLRFSGVTDRYLHDVIGSIWPRAAKAFWLEVEKHSRFARDKPKAKDED